MWVGHCAVIVKLANKHYVITGPIAHASPLAVCVRSVGRKYRGQVSRVHGCVCVAGKEAPHYSHNKQLIKSSSFCCFLCHQKLGRNLGMRLTAFPTNHLSLCVVTTLICSSCWSVQLQLQLSLVVVLKDSTQYLAMSP